MSRILTQQEKELLHQKILKLEQAFDRVQQSRADQDMLFDQILQFMEPGDKTILPDGREFHIYDPFQKTNHGERLTHASLPCQVMLRWAWELREDDRRWR